MGFFSHIEYSGQLPDGKTPENLVTDDLEYGELWYRISGENRLLRENDDSSVTDMNYTGSLYVYTMTGDEAYYFIFSENGFLESVQTAQ